jgi:hypothetical protein
MKYIAIVSLLVAGIIHLLPVPGVAGSGVLARLYGIEVSDPNTAILFAAPGTAVRRVGCTHAECHCAARASGHGVDRWAVQCSKFHHRRHGSWRVQPGYWQSGGR